MRVEKMSMEVRLFNLGSLHEEAIVNCVKWQVSRLVVIYNHFFSSQKTTSKSAKEYVLSSQLSHSCCD
jgi:hypothetical protein